MSGPLSMPLQDKERYHALDTAEKRALAQEKNTLVTGKTAHDHKYPSTAVAKDKAPKNLAIRIKDWESSKQCQDHQDAFHRPGSNKK
jgi:hypothetical protein